MNLLTLNFDLDVITTSIEFPEYAECIREGIHVVTVEYNVSCLYHKSEIVVKALFCIRQPIYVAHAIKMNALPKPGTYSADPSMFMSGLVVAATESVSGYLFFP